MQSKTGIDILTLSTGRYYVTNSTNLPTGWVAAYLDVERLDNQWCRITAWPPYTGIEPPYITKQCNGTWQGWEKLITNVNLPFTGGAIKFEVGYDYNMHRDYMGLFYDNGNATIIIFDDTGIQCDVLEGTKWRTKWRK